MVSGFWQSQSDSLARVEKPMLIETTDEIVYGDVITISTVLGDGTRERVYVLLPQDKSKQGRIFNESDFVMFINKKSG